MTYRNSFTNVDSPLGIILVSKDDSAERVLFMYPFDLHVIEKTGDVSSKHPKDDGNVSSHGYACLPSGLREFGVPVKMLAPLLCPKESGGSPFEIKIDNIRFAGFPWRIENSAHSLAVVFVLPGSVESHIVDSFQQLSKKVAIAINNEQQRCNYLRDQIALMQPAHDEFEALLDEQKKGLSPYPAILEKCGLAQHLKEIFEDVCEYGMVDVFVDDCIEVGFCVEPKALVQAGLAPKSSQEVENIMRHVCPYHGILFLEDTLPSPDANPSVLRFLDKYEPSRRMANAFAEKFPDCSLAEIVEQFSPPSSLSSFLTDIALYSTITKKFKRSLNSLQSKLSARIKTAVNASSRSEEILTPELKTYLLDLCAQAIDSGVPEAEVFWLVSSFTSFMPYLDGHHHIEDIMYRTHLDRSTIMRVIDTFSELVQPFYCSDSPALLSI